MTKSRQAQLVALRTAHRFLLRCENGEWTWRDFKDQWLEPAIKQLEEGVTGKQDTKEVLRKLDESVERLENVVLHKGVTGKPSELPVQHEAKPQAVACADDGNRVGPSGGDSAQVGKPSEAGQVPGNVLVSWFDGNPYVSADAYIRASQLSAPSARVDALSAAQEACQDAIGNWGGPERDNFMNALSRCWNAIEHLKQHPECDNHPFCKHETVAESKGGS